MAKQTPNQRAAKAGAAPAGTVQAGKAIVEIGSNAAGAIPIPAAAEIPPKTYTPRHIDLHVTPAQALALKRLTLALQAEGVNAKTGQDAVRYLLDGLVHAYAAAPAA